MVDSSKEDLSIALNEDNFIKPSKEIVGFEKRLSDRISKLMKVFVADKQAVKDITTE